MSPPLKIAVCQRVCPEYNIPLFERLCARYDIEFVFSRFGQQHAFFFDPARLARVRYRTLRPLPFPLLPFRSRVLNKLSYLAHGTALVVQLAWRLIRGRYDVIVGGEYLRFECVVAFVVARLRGRLFVAASDDWHWPRTRRDRLRVPLVRAMIRRAAALIAGGSKALEQFRALGAGDTPIFNVFHTNVSVRPPELRAPAADRFVLYVGRLDERKGVEYLLTAFAEVRADHGDVRLKVLGRGERLEALRALARRLGIDAAVDFVGWVEHAEVDRYYAACAAFVLPSIFTADGGYEPFSNVVLEAMACGAPVISTTANGASWDVIESGVNGLVVPDRDAPALAQALRRLLDDPAAAEVMGRRGWETIRDRFNVDLMAERFGAALDYVTRKALSERA